MYRQELSQARAETLESFRIDEDSIQQQKDIVVFDEEAAIEFGHFSQKASAPKLDSGQFHSKETGTTESIPYSLTSRELQGKNKIMPMTH